MSFLKPSDVQNIFACNTSLQTQERLRDFISPINEARQISCKGRLVEKKKSAFGGKIITLSYENANEDCLLPDIFLKEALGKLQNEVNSFLKVNFALKFNIELHALYTKPHVKELDTSLEVNIFKTEMQELFSNESFENECLTQMKNIVRKTELFRTRESGWTLLQLIKVEFNLNKYQPLKGAGFMQLPRKWAVIAAVSDLQQNNTRPSKYKVNIFDKTIKLRSCILNFEGLHFPLEVKNVSIFEENNPSISINVFGYDKENDVVIGPYYKTKKIKSKHINLLFFEDNINQKTLGHYVWIRSLSRLVRPQLTLHNQKINLCDACLQYFYTESDLEKHIENSCQKDEDVLEEDKCVLQFKNHVKTVDVPFVIYANSECLFENDETHNSIPFAYSYFIKCSYNNSLNKFRSFTGINSSKLFVKSLIKDAKYFYNSYSIKIEPKIPLTGEENLEYKRNDKCYICSKVIAEENKVKLHCRLTGKYMGPAHHSCAFSYRIPKKFPVICYNLSVNDCLLLIKEFNDVDDDPVNLISLNNELYSCFEKDISLEKIRGKLELRFLNSFMFMPLSLDNLAQTLSESDFETLKSIYSDNDKFSLLIRKGVFPYSYLNSIEKLTDTCLPSIDNFYNSLLGKACSAEDYDHAQKVWSEFNCKTLSDYLMLCIKTDVLLLTDIFEKFRSVCKKSFNLDPCHYYTAAEFSWDAMLKKTEPKLNLLTDKSMVSFLQEGMRGGLFKCFQRYSAANNKYLLDFNDKLPSKYLMYFHANDLYGRTMLELLPEGHFEWETDIEHFSLDLIPNDSKIGYILEVDLEYPKDVYEAHKSLPFLFCENKISSETKEKIVIDLNNKYNYVIYYKNLQQCLKHGLKIQKIHRILKFNQSDWLKKYIMLNNNHRAKAKTPFEMNVFQLLNSALYEKIMAKIEKKSRVFQKWESDGRRLGARVVIMKPEFSSVKVLDESLITAEVNINPYRHMPIYLEFIISELAKWKVYSFHYDYIMPKYKNNVQLNYIDTDSLIYTITTDDFYQDVAHDIYLMFNTPGCDADNNSSLSLKSLGMMKDANHGIVVKEYIALRSKMYSLKTEDIEETNVAKIWKNNICKYTSLSDYKNYLCNEQINCGNIYVLKSKLHKRYSKLINELYLSYLNNTQ